MIGKYLKEYKKNFKKDCKEYRCKPNHDWRKRWLPIIKYDHDFDGAYFLDLIMHKLNIMYDYYDFGYYIMQSDESKKEILDTLKEAIDLGKKIQEHDYNEGSDNFMDEHCAHLIYIYNKPWKLGQKEEPIHTIVHWRKDRCLEDYFGSNEAKQWALDNGYDPKTIHTSAGGQWDDMKNHDTWMKMIQAEAKEEQKDIEKFFGLLAKNYRKWWD